MPLSKETVQAMARELENLEVGGAGLDAVMALLGPALEGVAQLDALDLEALEPAFTFDPAAE